MSKRLSYDETIAVTLGLEAGAAYERLRWLIEESEAREYIGEMREGKQWVGFTYERLRTGYLKVFKSDKTLRDALNLLEKHGLIMARANGRGKWFALGSTSPDSLKADDSPTQSVEQSSPNGQPAMPNSSVRVTKTAGQSDENSIAGLPDSSVAIYKDLDSEDSTKNSTPDSTVDSSSSPTPPAPLVVKEEEISKSPIVLSEIEVLEKAYSDLCGVWEGSSKAIRAQVKTNLALLVETTPHLTAADFEDFKAYYEVVTAQKPHPIKPTPNFVTGGWQQFQDWQTQYLSGTVWEYLPGVEERSIAFTRSEWRDLQRAEAGSFWRLAVGFALKGFRKVSNDLWVEVPAEQWPDWAKESA
jgi:hypothetical protein